MPVMNDKIVSVLKKVLNVEDVDANISRTNCIQWDSMRHLNLIVELEIVFDIEFEPEEIAEIKCFADITRFVSDKIEK
jgi:acyl carrier protein